MMMQTDHKITEGKSIHTCYCTYQTAMIQGTISIIYSVIRGLRPTAVSPAYDNAPATPAIPVPELHVDTTFLQNNYK